MESILLHWSQNRECNLGEIVHGKMILSDFGKILETEWYKSFEIRDELFLDEFVIMPNHLHAIVILKNESIVDTHGRAYLLRISDQFNQPIFKRKPKSISSFIAGFKSVTNSKIDNYIDQNDLDIPKFNQNNHFWQPNYHDRIIRNDAEYQRIVKYIINNLKKWKQDKLKGK